MKTSQPYRDKYPLRYAYQNLKDNARRRRIYLDLTYEQFQSFCEESGYMYMKGPKRNDYGIDRIIEEKGYTAGNLQLLTNAENTKKQRDYERSKAKPVDEEEVPF